MTPDGGAELDPNLLFEQVCTVIDQVLRTNTTPVLAVATDTFWHSLLGVDADGRPLTPIYLWLDARSRGEVAGLRQQLDERAVHARVGCVFHWSYWPAKLSWLRHTQPDLYKRVHRWISFGELVLERLTGQTGTSVSMASGTGVLNVHSCEWDSEMLSALGLDRQHLGKLVALEHTSTGTSTTTASAGRSR